MAIRERHEVAKIRSFEAGFAKIARGLSAGFDHQAFMTSSLRPMEGVLGASFNQHVENELNAVKPSVGESKENPPR